METQGRGFRAGLIPAQGDHKGCPYVPVLLGNTVAKTHRDFHRVQGGKAKIIRDGPNPKALRVVWINRHTIDQDVIRTGNLDLSGRLL